jgi:hypothetical protein
MANTTAHLYRTGVRRDCGDMAHVPQDEYGAIVSTPQNPQEDTTLQTWHHTQTEVV